LRYTGGFFLFFLAALFCACSINYREGQIAEELEETVPNIRMTGLRHRMATKDRLIMEMTARSSESFEAAKKIVIFGVDFYEYDQDGVLIAEGRADSVVYHTDTKNAEIEGNIELISHREKGSIRTQRLYWDDERRFLAGAAGEETEIFDEDGSHFSGMGFEADIKRLIISFMQTVDGNYVVEDDEAENKGEN
jgi:LPS export ABC transporter protein LptC